MAKIACPCPPKADGTLRHPDGDTIRLRERLDFHAATTIRKSIGLLYVEDPGASPAEVLAVLTENYILFGVEGWTLVDEKGKPLEVSRAAIRSRLLSGAVDVTELADAADALYAPTVMLPLLAAGRRSSPPGPTDGSTSATNGSSTKPPKRSRPSSTSTTPTGVTVAITSPLDGGSSTSPSSA
jgi:hypothetical protein